MFIVIKGLICYKFMPPSLFVAKYFNGVIPIRL